MYRIVILSKNPLNLIPCVQRIFKLEPDLPRQNIIVVDDGAMPAAAPELPGITWITGQKPFVFARNANIGLRHAFETGTGAVLLNDDALLKTRGGFSKLHFLGRSHPWIGLLSPAIDSVGNENQNYKGWDGLRGEKRMLCFVCVYLTKQTWDAVGELDERYISYGMDDDDYSLRVRKANLTLSITDQVEIDHTTLQSTYRGGPNHGDFRYNLELFRKKWGHDNFGVPV